MLRTHMRLVMGPLVIFALAVIIAPMMGCASAPKPLCEAAEAVILETREGYVYFGFDLETFAKWNATIRSEARGECEFGKGGMQS